MTLKRLCVVLLAVVAASLVAGQSEDIPDENDNLYPPQKHLDDEVHDGSGDVALEDPLEPTNETTARPVLEEVEAKVMSSDVTLAAEEEQSCPKPCVCNIEGGSDNFIVDCSGYALTEFPTPLDPRTTTLNVQNNKLTEIPKDVSSLKNLKILNADNNLIMDLAAGSVSELAELTVLKLANNRLVEFPKDLKNSFGLTKLEEIDLGGNDMRTGLQFETFENFKTLQKLTLPTSTSELVNDLCKSLQDTLETVCTVSCSKQSFECPEAPAKNEDGYFDAVNPGTMESPPDDDKDPEIKLEQDNDNSNSKIGDNDSIKSDTSEPPIIVPDNVTPTSRISLSSNIEDTAPIKLNSMVVDVPKETSPDIKESDVKLGATTVDAKTGGVDKSVIGIVVAGMVLIVAGITIKKNWSSIRKRFSSSPRAPNERGGANANGTTPEEVPLQDKSPV